LENPCSISRKSSSLAPLETQHHHDVRCRALHEVRISKPCCKLIYWFVSICVTMFGLLSTSRAGYFRNPQKRLSRKPCVTHAIRLVPHPEESGTEQRYGLTMDYSHMKTPLLKHIYVIVKPLSRALSACMLTRVYYTRITPVSMVCEDEASSTGTGVPVFSTSASHSTGFVTISMADPTEEILGQLVVQVRRYVYYVRLSCSLHLDAVRSHTYLSC
jgi:hypothetical protein